VADVADPSGQGTLAIERTADELQGLVEGLLDLARPKRRAKA
jgi:hypothetical protein